MQIRHSAIAGLALALGAGSAAAQDIKIAHVYDKTGALEAYAKQTQTGLMMGLEYATNGTMKVNGRKLVVIEKDSQFKPDVGKSQLASAFADDKATSPSGRPARAWRWRCCRWRRNTRRSCWSSPPWPIRSPATNGTVISSALAAIPRRMRSPTR